MNLITSDTNDIKYINFTIEIARSNIDPITNKGVGAIIVKDDKIISSGNRYTFLNHYSHEHKTVHAEQMAIWEAGQNVYDSILYTTLEPCTKRWWNSKNIHYYPCCNYIIKAGIKKVIIAYLDSSFGSNGIEFLQTHGIEVQIADAKLIDIRSIAQLTDNDHVDKDLEDEYKKFINNTNRYWFKKGHEDV